MNANRKHFPDWCITFCVPPETLPLSFDSLAARFVIGRVFYNLQRFCVIVRVVRFGTCFCFCLCFKNLQRVFCILMCCEFLQRMCCQTDEDVFFICWCFFYLHVFSFVAVQRPLSATVETPLFSTRSPCTQTISKLRSHLSSGSYPLNNVTKRK